MNGKVFNINVSEHAKLDQVQTDAIIKSSIFTYIPDFDMPRIARKGLPNISKLSALVKAAHPLLQSSELKLENHRCVTGENPDIDIALFRAILADYVSWIRLLQEVSKTYLYDAFKPYFISETSVTVLE